jgi:hypothetical protein
MKQQFKLKPKTIGTIAVAFTAFVILVGTQAIAQVQQQSPNIPPPQLPPGSVVIPPSQQHGPSSAQIQSDIARHNQNGVQYAAAMINLLGQRLGHDISTTHAIQVLKQMTAEGKINCPTPFTNPGHCFLTPKPVAGQIAPPIG